MSALLAVYTDAEPCACKRCVDMCRHAPGWPSVDEAAALIDAGLAERLMLDWWVRFPDDTEILCPAVTGYEGARAPDLDLGWLMSSKGTCTFLSADRCEIHGKSGRPIECRNARHDSPTNNIHEDVATAWNSDAGRALVARWKALVAYEDSVAREDDDDDDERGVLVSAPCSAPTTTRHPWTCYARPADKSGKACGYRNESGGVTFAGQVCCEECGCTKSASDDRQRRASETKSTTKGATKSG